VDEFVFHRDGKSSKKQVHRFARDDNEKQKPDKVKNKGKTKSKTKAETKSKIKAKTKQNKS
jgi:hypothetical protein